MKQTAEDLDAYRRQLHACAQALAVARIDDIRDQLPPQASAEPVKMFTDGNLDKRFLKLQEQLEFVAEGFEQFDDLIEQYVRSIPLEAYSTGATDAERFLVWVQRTQPVTAEQYDMIICQRSRHAVEFAARKNRMGHIRFQELWSMAERRAGEWGRQRRLWLHLNPIHVWSTFHTSALVDDDAELPATVLFYPVGNDIRTAVLERPAQALVCTLEDRGSQRLDDLLREADAGRRADLVELGRQLAETGLAAFG